MDLQTVDSYTYPLSVTLPIINQPADSYSYPLSVTLPIINEPVDSYIYPLSVTLPIINKPADSYSYPLSVTLPIINEPVDSDTISLSLPITNEPVDSDTRSSSTLNNTSGSNDTHRNGYNTRFTIKPTRPLREPPYIPLPLSASVHHMYSTYTIPPTPL